jgi:hypothetical protein
MKIVEDAVSHLCDLEQKLNDESAVRNSALNDIPWSSSNTIELTHSQGN